MAIGYHGIKLSNNVVETPEGYLVFKNAVIARTGFYEYKGRELLSDEITARELEEQGVEVDPEAMIKVYRSPEEVFSKRSIDSFQGKPVTDGHPPKMLNLDTVAEHECGQVFNVREGKEPLEDGNFPLLGDIIVKNADLIAKWRAGLRELSNGYNYHIVKLRDMLAQVDILGNHVAFVENGRAGMYARVNDSKTSTGEMTMEQQTELAVGTGLKHVAEKSTAAELGAFLKGILTFGRGGAAMDAEEDEHPKGCRCDDCKPGAKDAKAKDEAEKAEKEKAEKEKAEAEDKAAMDALEKELKGEAEDEDEHPKGCRCDDCKPAAKDANGDEMEEEDAGEAADDLEDIASPVIAPADRQQKDTPSATDAAYKAGAEAMLKALKPFVARSKDTRLAKAFDTADKTVKGTGWKGAASYGAVARAAGTANDSLIASGQDAVAKQIEAAEKSYAESRAKKLGRK